MERTLLEKRVQNVSASARGKSRLHDVKPFALYYAESPLKYKDVGDKETGTYSPEQKITQKDD